MSLSVYASLAIGVKLEFQPSTTLETRYNQGTGEPYQIEVEGDGCYVISGTDITVKVLDYGDEEEEGASDAIPRDDYGDSSTLSYIEGSIAGVIIRQVRNPQEVEVSEVPAVELTNTIDSVRRQLSERFGYTDSIGVFLVKEISY